MEKKPYEAPIVKKVRLDIKTAVLSECHSSMIADSMFEEPGCKQNGICAMD